jgi:hypothetical protein
MKAQKHNVSNSSNSATNMMNLLTAYIDRVSLFRIHHPRLHARPVGIGQVLSTLESHGLKLFGAGGRFHDTDNLPNQSRAVVAARPASLDFPRPGIDQHGMRRGAASEKQHGDKSYSFHGFLSFFVRCFFTTFLHGAKHLGQRVGFSTRGIQIAPQLTHLAFVNVMNSYLTSSCENVKG